MEARKVLLNDKLDGEGVELLHRANFEVDEAHREHEELIKVIGEFDAMIVRGATIVNRDILKQGNNGRLEIVVRAGVGYDNIDIKAATKYGITVKNAPSGNTVAAGEYTLGLMLAMSRFIPESPYYLKNGVWRRQPFYGNELEEKTMGIIGCGRIGQRVSQLAVAFGMRILGYDRNADNLRGIFPNSGIRYTTLNSLLEESDYVSLHVSGVDKIIGKEEFEKMKPDAYLINMSRGSNVDEDALHSALKNKKIKGAALDVHSQEPKEGENFSYKWQGLNVIATPHLGAATVEAGRKTTIEAAQGVVGYFRDGDMSNAINIKNQAI